MPSIGSLFISLGFDVDDKKLDDFNAKLKTGFEGLGKVAAAAAAAVFGIDKFLQGPKNAAVALNDFHEQTGLATEAAQRWAYVVSTLDPAETFEAAVGSIKNVQKALSDTAFMGTHGGAFAMLGIQTAGKNAYQVLEEFRNNWANINKRPGGRSTAIDLMGAIGLDAGFANTFDAAPGRFNQLYGGANVMSPQMIASAQKYAETMQQAENAFAGIRNIVASEAFGILTRDFDDFAKVIPKLSTSLGPVLAKIEAVTSLFGGLRTSLGVVMAGVMAVLAPIPLAIAAVIAGLVELGRFLAGDDDPFITGVKNAVTWLERLAKAKAAVFGQYFHAATGPQFGPPDLVNRHLYSTAAGPPRPPENLIKPTTVSQTYHIQGTGDARSIADRVASIWKSTSNEIVTNSR